MKAPAFLTAVDDSFFRAAALRQERARLALSAEQRAALDQAALLVEIARRVARPVEALPAGARPAVRLSLYRDAVYWAFVAARPGTEPPPPDLRACWTAQPASALAALAPEGALAVVERALLDTPASSLAVTEEEATAAGAFAEALVAELEAPRARVERIRGQRWARIFAALGMLVVALLGLRALALGPNLAAGKPFRTSSSWAGCANDPPCMALAFHTEPQADPWAMLDLGRPTAFHRIEVTNRQDCCGDRAVPLVVEVGDDNAHWREVARRDDEFSSWTIKLPSLTARYLRFRVPRQTVLHLQRVAVR
jgi:hypothetical protein